MNVRDVCIVGAGSAGWMTSAALSKRFPSLKITLIESPDIPTVGVGESTIARINHYLDAIGLEDKDWMKACNATYKSSIQFTDFKEKGHSFQYPFGFKDMSQKFYGITDWFWIEQVKPIEDATFAEYHHDSAIALKHNKFPTQLANFNFKYDVAYHMDAGLFGEFLRDNICIPNGVIHIKDTVVECKKKEDTLDCVVTKNNGSIKADLFIDCTGFKSLLLEETMGAEFESFGDTLMNDSALATRIPYEDKEKEMLPITNCTAIDNGWVWNIPLWNRIGTGYVYSSKFATKDQAEKEFRAHLGERGKTAEIKHIKIKHGAHKTSWIKNVVAVGLSNGFIEPLESTGLVLTHDAIHLILDILEQRNGYVNQYDIDTYNYAMYDTIKGFKDFISLHYALSTRNDTPYWKHVTEGFSYSQDMINYNELIQNEYQDLASALHISSNFNKIDRGGGLIYLAAGMGYSPVTSRKLNYQLTLSAPPIMSARETWIEHRKELLKSFENEVSHYEYLKNNIYN
jgi:flavin-dependent dehydrogenase